MYYRKYFSGSVDATTTTNQYYMGLDKVATGTSRGSGHIKNRSDVIGNALVSTFRDIGYPNAYWDSTSVRGARSWHRRIRRPLRRASR